MSFCPTVPGLLATAATDKKTKLWDLTGGAPSMLASQDLQVGCVWFYFKQVVGLCVPFLLAALDLQVG